MRSGVRIMGLSTGVKLGPYEVMQSVGAGGMGEVYRARDPRLGREVAVKVLPPSFSADPGRLRRFEQEARAAAALNHPNILAVFDIGTDNGSPYIISELLEGETLRTQLRSGPLSLRKTADYAQQIARGLAAAHDKGIIHRDLKPENIFITEDGRAKILDFGLAKLTHAESVSPLDTVTMGLARESDPGTVLGTVGYMSPEQVRGKPVDARSDLFSFGAILYEMLSGKRAFQGESAAETMSAIVKEEPPELSQANAHVSTALEHIVRHCLEKEPVRRFQSAHDVAFDLEMVSSTSTTATPVTAMALKRRRMPWLLGGVAAAVLLALAVVLLARSIRPQVSVPSFEQITYRRGTVMSGKFAPDGQVVYSAAWEGASPELFMAGTGGRGSVSTGLHDSDIESISTAGEMLLVTNRIFIPGGYVRPGMLSRAPLSGGSPRDILEDVQDADWGPDGTIAAARYVGQQFQLEYPVGHVIYKTTGWITFPRVSPDGSQVAFLDHRLFGDDRGTVAVVDRQGHERILSPEFASIQALAWAPSGNELWFTAASSGTAADLYGVTLGGKLRTVLRVPGGLRLLDIAHHGRVLIIQGRERRSLMVGGPGQKTEHDLAVADYSVPIQFSQDGQTLLISEQAEGTATTDEYLVYLRKVDGSPPVRLGKGFATALSADGKWVLATSMRSPSQVVLLPTGAGETREITNDNISHRVAAFLRDDKHFLFSGDEPGHAPRVYVQEIDGSGPRPLTPEGVYGFLRVSPDGNMVVISGQRQSWLLPVGGGEPQLLRTVTPGEGICGWSADSRSLYVVHPGLPTKLFKLDTASGKREPIREFAPADRAGVEQVGPIDMTADLRAYAYGFSRILTDMYVVDGLR